MENNYRSGPDTHDWYHERQWTCVLCIVFNLSQYVIRIHGIPLNAWHEVMALALSPHNGDMYLVHFLTDETILANLKET